MPRAGQVKPPAGERLPDRIAIGLLTVTFPPELVDRVVVRRARCSGGPAAAGAGGGVLRAGDVPVFRSGL